MASGPEAKLIKKMRDAAQEKYGSRIVVVKYHGSQFSEAGVHDLLCCLDGMFVSVEVKAPETYWRDGSPSVEAALEMGPTLKQRAFAKRVEKAGGIAAFAADVKGFMQVLYEVEKGII